jgi:hypothetical protein
MNLAHFTDIAVPLAGAAVAAFLVLRWGFFGFLAGIVTVWASGLLRIQLLNALDHGRDTGVLDAMWVVFTGWVAGFSWCLPFLLGRFIYRYARARGHSRS